MQERRNRFMAMVLALAMLMLAPVGVGAQGSTPVSGSGHRAELEASTSWLISQQADDGGFPGMSGESDPSVTIDAIVALASARSQGIDTGDTITSAFAWLASGDTALVFAQTGQGQAAKLVLGAVAAGVDPSDIQGVNPVALINAGVRPDTGMYGAGIFDHALVILALAATDNDVPAEAIAALEETQTPEGGWAFDGASSSGAADSNTTALVVQALIAAGEGDSPLVSSALDYLHTAVEDDSGAVFQPGGGTPPDSSSTAMVVQAVLAAGEDPSSAGWGNLTSALVEFQNDNGAFFFNADDTSDNLFSTATVIPALAGQYLPVIPEMGGASPASTPVGLVPAVDTMAA